MGEISNAFQAADEANRISSNTVWGVALSSFGWMGYRNWTQVIELLESNRESSNKFNLKLGVRLEICEEILPKKRPEDV